MSRARSIVRPTALLAALLLLAAPASAEDKGGKSLLIIAPRAFHKALGDFVRHKEALLSTELVALEKALESSHGVDDPERLKRFLYEAWRKRGIGYVLLVGDVDVLPMRYMVLDRCTPAAFDYAFYPCDLYYADLAKSDGRFDDWNARKNGFHGGYFGEVRGEKNKKDPINYDQVDYRPEIAVGRWPVSTVAEVECVAAKTIAYEKGLLAHRGRPALKGDFRQAALFSVAGWVDTRPRLDNLAGELHKAGWTVTKRYYTDGGKKPATPPPDEKELLDILHHGTPLIVHTGHGSENSWEGCFSVASLSKVKNADRLPVMLSIGCSTAHCAPLGPYAAYVDVEGREHQGTDHGEVFKAPPPPPAPYQKGKYNVTGLGEQLLRAGPHGAVAYIGCNTGSQPCALTLLDGFLLSLAKQRQPRLGDCWGEAVRYYYDKEGLENLKPNDDWYPPSIFFQGMKFMVFGDPSLRLPEAR
jgi:hypothetical protein